MKQVNLNDMVKVKLTPRGVDIYYHQFDELNEKLVKRGCEPLERPMPQIDKDGYTKFQLWHFMQLYGPHIDMVCELPCATDILIKVGDVIEE